MFMKRPTHLRNKYRLYVALYPGRPLESAWLACVVLAFLPNIRQNWWRFANYWSCICPVWSKPTPLKKCKETKMRARKLLSICTILISFKFDITVVRSENEMRITVDMMTHRSDSCSKFHRCCQWQTWRSQMSSVHICRVKIKARFVVSQAEHELN